MDALDREIAAYDGMRDILEKNYSGKWVVFHDQQLTGCYDDFQDAAAEAVKRFGRGPYLIRRVGAANFKLPASIQYRRINAYG